MYRSYRREAIEAFNQAKLRALTKIGLYIDGETKLRSAVDTGNMRSSFDYDVDADESKVVNGSSCEYFIFVEKGTSKQQAQPCLTPAVEDNIETIKQIVKEEMKID